MILTWVQHRQVLCTAGFRGQTTSTQSPAMTLSWEEVYLILICQFPSWYCNPSFWETDVKLDFFDKSVQQISSPPKEVAAYLAIVHPFGVYVWICILLSTCTVPLVFIIMDHTYFYAFQTHRTEYVFEGNSVIHSDFLSLISKVKKGPHWKKASRHQMLSN